MAKKRVSEVREMLEMLAVLVFFGLLCSPIMVFEMNAHSAIQQEVFYKKTGWVNVSTATPRGGQFISLRDRPAPVTVRCFGGRGCAPSAIVEEMWLESLPAEVVQDSKYEFDIVCTEQGPIPVLAMQVECRALAVKSL